MASLSADLIHLEEGAETTVRILQLPASLFFFTFSHVLIAASPIDERKLRNGAFLPPLHPEWMGASHAGRFLLQQRLLFSLSFFEFSQFQGLVQVALAHTCEDMKATFFGDIFVTLFRCQI